MFVSSALSSYRVIGVSPEFLRKRNEGSRLKRALMASILLDPAPLEKLHEKGAKRGLG